MELLNTFGNSISSFLVNYGPVGIKNAIPSTQQDEDDEDDDEVATKNDRLIDDNHMNYKIHVDITSSRKNNTKLIKKTFLASMKYLCDERVIRLSKPIFPLKMVYDKYIKTEIQNFNKITLYTFDIISIQSQNIKCCFLNINLNIEGNKFINRITQLKIENNVCTIEPNKLNFSNEGLYLRLFKSTLNKHEHNILINLKEKNIKRLSHKKIKKEEEKKQDIIYTNVSNDTFPYHGDVFFDINSYMAEWLKWNAYNKWYNGRTPIIYQYNNNALVGSTESITIHEKTHSTLNLYIRKKLSELICIEKEHDLKDLAVVKFKDNSQIKLLIDSKPGIISICFEISYFSK